jgi:hypothetical protein
MKNLHLKFAAVPVFFCFLIFTSCEKTNKEELIHNSTSISADDYGSSYRQFSKPTLEEFINSVKSEEEIAFFDNTDITDNTSVVREAISTGQELQAKPQVKLRWHGKYAQGGCVKPLGGMYYNTIWIGGSQC